MQSDFKSITKALVDGIQNFKPMELFGVLEQIEGFVLPKTAKDNFYQTIGQDFHVKNDLQSLKYAYSLYAQGYVQASKDKVLSE